MMLSLINAPPWTVLLVPLLSFNAVGGNMTYAVTLNADVCHEVHLGWLTAPVEAAPFHEVSTGYCLLDMRSPGEAELYMTAVCSGPRGTWPSAPEKYTVDLSGRKGVRRISDAEWQSAVKLPRADGGVEPQPAERGVRYNGGPLLEKSGPRWTGAGSGPIGSFFSLTRNRTAVNSWDGFDITYSFLDLSSAGKHNKVKGRYWVDIYETKSARALVRVEGTFNGAEPIYFQGQAHWYADRYYVLPVGRTTGTGSFSLRRLLICDVDAAARKGETVLKKRK